MEPKGEGGADANNALAVIARDEGAVALSAGGMPSVGKQFSDPSQSSRSDDTIAKRLEELEDSALQWQHQSERMETMLMQQTEVLLELRDQVALLHTSNRELREELASPARAHAT